MNETYNNINEKNNDFLENIYGTLFYPRETFERLKQTPPIIEALFLVVAISLIKPFIEASFFKDQNLTWFIFDLFKAGFGGIIKWLFFAAFIEGVASVFKNGGNYKTFLALSAFALIPWIFMGPVFLFKTGGILAALLGILSGIAIWIWTTILTILAIMKAYNVSSGRILLLLSIPFLGGIIFFNWMIGFFSTLFEILKV